MAKLKFKLEVVEPAPVIERRIKDSISNHINIAARLSLRETRKKVADLLTQSILDSHEVKELLNGQLRHELGATQDEVDATIDFLINRLVATTVIDFKAFQTFGKKFNGYIEVRCFPKTIIDDMIAFPKASFLTKKGVNIPWMQWLLTFGDKILVKRYTVDFFRTAGSRTGGATMKPIKRGGWRIPSGFSGTRNDNFITRALDNLADYIGYIMRTEFTKKI